jgi:CPA1 family monovalent cation:H+ antiporter
VVQFELLLALLLLGVALASIARRLRTPYPVLLALIGAALAFVPNLPELNLEPELVLALFVSPVLLMQLMTLRSGICETIGGRSPDLH